MGYDPGIIASVVSSDSFASQSLIQNEFTGSGTINALFIAGKLRNLTQSCLRDSKSLLRALLGFSLQQASATLLVDADLLFWDACFSLSAALCKL